MINAEFKMLQDRVLLIARFCYDTPDLAEFLQAIDRADTLGPFVDPTLWMRGHEKMSIIKELAVQVEALRALVARRRDEILMLEAR